MSGLADHFATGCWRQPDGSYAGECSCGHGFHEATYAGAKEAWAAHAATPTEDARERVKVLEEALQDICNPLRYLRRVAEAEGKMLGGMAYTIANDISTLQRIARTALGNKETDRHG